LAGDHSRGHEDSRENRFDVIGVDQVNIVYVYADSKLEWNCAEWRCVIPAKAIQKTGRNSAELIDIASFATNSKEAQMACSSADVIVVQRNLFGAVLSMIQRWKARDKVVVADFDDAYDLMPPTVKSYSFWIEGNLPPEAEKLTNEKKMVPPPLTQFKWGLRLVHAATMPSKVLAEDWRAYTETYYLPNYLDTERYLNYSPTPHDGIIIGWGGSLSHLQSFRDSGLMPALVKVINSRQNVRLMICGDPRVYESIPLEEGKKIFQKWVPPLEWPRILSYFDIGLAPLAGEYDNRRSWIKVMEYMLMKIPWIASDCKAYTDLRPYGLMVKNAEENWEFALSDMLDRYVDYKYEAGGEPYLYAIGQDVNENVDRILGIYSTIQRKVFSN